MTSSKPGAPGGLAVILASLALAACSKASEGTLPAQAAPSSSASAVAVASSTPPPRKPEPATILWSGTYVSTPGSLYVYDGGEWKGVHFRGDDASDGLGEGSLSLTIDRKTNVLHGSASGAIGDVVLSGAVTEGQVSFTVSRKDAADRGLTGTGVGKLSAEALVGTIRLSRGDAHVIREVKFKLTQPPS